MKTKFCTIFLSLLAVSFVACSKNIKINEKNFPDEKFRNYLLKEITEGLDGILTAEEIATITELDVSGKDIVSLQGIEHFTALEELRCDSNKMTALDVSKNTALKVLFCYNNKLRSLDVSNNTALTMFSCYNNKLTSLDISKNTALKSFVCNDNGLTSLDVSKNTALGILSCDNNELTSLDVSGCTDLMLFSCCNNLIRGAEMDRLVNSLPDRTGLTIGLATTVSDSLLDGNVCTESQVAAMKAKNWVVANGKDPK